MISLAVYLNGKKLTVAGADDLGVLNAIVNAVGSLGKSTAPVGKGVTRDLWLSVSGLTRRIEGAQDEHLRWIRMKPASAQRSSNVAIGTRTRCVPAAVCSRA